MNITDRVFECLCRGISDSTWEKFNTLEKEAYKKSHPHSRFAEKENAEKNFESAVKDLVTTCRFVGRFMGEKPKVWVDETGGICFEGVLELSENMVGKDGKLRLKFGEVIGKFRLPKGNKLKSLEGCPRKVTGEFSCSGCKGLKTLKGAPQCIFGGFSSSDDLGWCGFDCSECDGLTSLEGCPSDMTYADFKCNNCNKLKDLKGAPTECGCFNCEKCENLQSLEGCPRRCNGYFNCQGCSKLMSLDGCPRRVKDHFWCRGCGKDFDKTDIKSCCNIF